MATLWPVVVNRLVALIPTLPAFAGVTVYDGPPVTETAAQTFISVGHVTGEVAGGSYSIPESIVDAVREESGEVRCEIVAWTGTAGDLNGRRAAVFALFDALAASVRADQTLGVLPYASTSYLTGDVLPAQGGTGATVRLAVSIHYFARQ